MKSKLLIIDNDSENIVKYKPVWNEHGFELVSVSTMQKAFELVCKEPFVVIEINADRIDCLSHLKILQNITNASIHVTTTHYDLETHIAVISHGANVFSQWCDDIDMSARRSIAQINRHFANISLPNRPIYMLSFEDLSLYPDFFIATVKGEPLLLDPKEFELLHFLMEDNGMVLRYETILLSIWGLGFESSSHKLVWNHITSLRRKIGDLAGSCDYIENIHTRRGISFRGCAFS